MKPFFLPAGFLLGSATSATQIEGGDRNNNWFDWCGRGKIKDGSSTLSATGHWDRVGEDVALLTAMHQKIYRMSVEWSRIEPQKGCFDEAAMTHYRDELQRLIRAGIRPLVTLHHFTNPLWLCEEGEFESPGVVAYFERYVRYVVSHIGDLVSDYITINEPNVYVVNGYVFGSWPPGRRSLRLAVRVYLNMTRCHIAAYKAIHELRGGFDEPTKVGVAHHLRVFAPFHRLNPLDHLAAALLSALLQRSAVRLMTQGTPGFLLGLLMPRRLKGNYSDFLGINYYTRSSVHFWGLRDDVHRGVPHNDLGWEIYPRGIAKLCEEYYKKFRLPIWITENGACDGRDALRAEFIGDHLRQLTQAIAHGARVERYYHWSLLDNFEWLDGESARFGLVEVDYPTQRRTVRASGALYAEICRHGALTQRMIDDYERAAEPVAEAE